MKATSPLGTTVQRLAREIAPEVRELREDLHAHPELRFQEQRTAALCAAKLESLGVEVRTGVGATGVVGLLRGGRTTPTAKTAAFRAEMDALPMDDRCGKPYASTNPGVAHLCGHDGHVAALLGTATVLARLRDRLPGNVKLLFEPAEEATPPGEISGAEAMIRDGALDDPTPDAVFGGHFYPDWPAGSIALREGASFTGNDSVKLRITGRESHSAVPSSGVDAIVVAAHVITAIQSLAAREIDIEEAASLTLGTIQGGRAPNLLAEQVDLTGTFRVSDESIRDRLPALTERAIKGVCDTFGATYDLDYGLRSLPPVICTAKEVALMRDAVGEVLGEDRVISMRHPRLAADTMHHWLNRAPGVFFMVGTASEDPATQYPSHHQRFDIAPETWPAVVAAEAYTALKYLGAT